MTATSTLPPPLSAPPTVATLQGLLDGLQQPMHRGVPSPPSSPTTPSLFEAPTEPAVPQPELGEGTVLDLTRLEQLAATSHADGAPAPAPEAPTAAAAPPPRVPLTWSAGRAHSHPRRTAAVAVASAAVVALAAFAAATGELTLP